MAGLGILVGGLFGGSVAGIVVGVVLLCMSAGVRYALGNVFRIR